MAKETFNQRYFKKRCSSCDALGYRTRYDYTHKQRFCFIHNRYIGLPDKLVCSDWKPTD